MTTSLPMRAFLSITARSIEAPRPMPTATRARFHPGEDRAPLAAPADEAARLLSELGLTPA